MHCVRIHFRTSCEFMHARLPVVLLLQLMPTLLAGQNPGQNVSLDIRTTGVLVTGDTTRISFVVTNRPISAEPLWMFVVDAPANVLRLSPSTGGLRWRSDTDFRGEGQVASWIFLYEYLSPGSSTPALQFESVGVPGILSYWAGGHFRAPSGSDEPEPDTTALPDPWVTAMITGKTVGVEPWPADRSAQALLARLRTLTESTCSSGLQWITDAGICSELVGDVNQAESFRSSGQMMSARTTLLHFQTLISEGRATGRVNSSAYWLLKANSDIVYGLM